MIAQEPPKPDHIFKDDISPAKEYSYNEMALETIQRVEKEMIDRFRKDMEALSPFLKDYFR